MCYLVVIIFAMTIITSCSKSGKEKDPIVVCPAASWLDQKKAELSSCVCLTGIYQGTYLGQVVYEVRGMDPLCNGINMVHYFDGTSVVNSGEPSKYQSYLSSVQNLQLVWSCSKAK